MAGRFDRAHPPPRHASTEGLTPGRSRPPQRQPAHEPRLHPEQLAPELAPLAEPPMPKVEGVLLTSSVPYEGHDTRGEALNTIISNAAPQAWHRYS
jgi:hypothetical protein